MSPSKYSSTSAKWSVERIDRRELNSRLLWLPRRVGVSIRVRSKVGRVPGSSAIAPLVWPLTWQSKQAVPRTGFSVTRCLVWLNQVVGNLVTSSRKPSSCSGVMMPSNSSRKLAWVIS